MVSTLSLCDALFFFFLNGNKTLKKKTHLAHETGLAVLKDNELESLVEETVAAISVPAGAGDLVAGDGAGVIQAEQEDRRLDLAEELLVLRASVDKSLAGLLFSRWM